MTFIVFELGHPLSDLSTPKKVDQEWARRNEKQLKLSEVCLAMTNEASDIGHKLWIARPSFPQVFYEAGLSFSKGAKEYEYFSDPFRVRLNIKSTMLLAT